MVKRNALPSMRTTVVCALLSANIAIAGNPVVCTPGYYDATCNGKIAAGYQAAPTCPTDPGWITVSPAQWQGSKFSSPQCSYQARPACPAGMTQTAAPVWNGAAWVGMTCQPSAPTITLPQLAAACESAIGANMARAGYNGTNGTYRGVWGSLQGPYAVGPGQDYPAQVSFAGMGGSGPGGTGPGDFYYVRDVGNPGGGGTGGNGIGVCWFQGGTANLTGFDYLEDLGNLGG